METDNKERRESGVESVLQGRICMGALVERRMGPHCECVDMRISAKPEVTEVRGEHRGHCKACPLSH